MTLIASVWRGADTNRKRVRLLSLIRLNPPRHAIRRVKQHVARRRAAKALAAPIVSATVIVAEAGTVAPAHAHAHAHASETLDRADESSPSNVATSTTDTVAIPPTTVTVSPLAPATTTTGAAQPPSTTSPPVTRLAVPAPRRASTPTRSATSRPAPPRPVAHPTAAPVKATASIGPHTAHTVPLGVYAGETTAAIASFAAATGTHPVMAADYLNGTSGWGAMVSTGALSPWVNSGYRLVLAVPIIPDGTGGTLAGGASGSYNSYFVTLAQNLVNMGLSNTILRLGWEFNGNWFNWAVTSATDAANYAGFFRNIVNAMRSVPGQAFQFSWNPNGAPGQNAYTPDQAYPGDAYVDYVGTDVYDDTWATPKTSQVAWANDVSAQWGLNWLAGFAAAHGKPIAFPEWSVAFRPDGAGLGDDPYFVNQLAAWITGHNVAFTDIFSFNAPDGESDITDGNFPNALAAFKADFGAL